MTGTRRKLHDAGIDWTRLAEVSDEDLDHSFVENVLSGSVQPPFDGEDINHPSDAS